MAKTYETKAAIFEAIQNHLADILEIDPAAVNVTSSFNDDLNADSLALIELVEAMEDEFSSPSNTFRIEDEDLEDLKTVSDAVDYIAEKLGVEA
ncbi:MAG: acyl carrier protein [Actinomycetota bacterium]|nr:acyl carrier protein [Actinomycetota bacterium]